MSRPTKDAVVVRVQRILQRFYPLPTGIMRLPDRADLGDEMARLVEIEDRLEAIEQGLQTKALAGRPEAWATLHPSPGPAVGGPGGPARSAPGPGVPPTERTTQ